jgi:hypothetical protein
LSESLARTHRGHIDPENAIFVAVEACQTA